MITMKAILIAFCISITGFIAEGGGNRASGANKQPAAQDQMPAEELLGRLQELHNTSIFYLPYWFRDKHLDKGLLELSLSEAVFAIGRELNLTPLFVDDNVMFVPAEGRDERGVSVNLDQLTVGSPEEFGRHPRATLSGKVVCGTTGETLIGAVVYDPVSGEGVASNLDGRFSIVLPTGDLRLRLSYVGYEVLYQPLRLYSDGEASFELFESSVQLGEVTVVARRAEENVSRTQMSLISLDSKAIEELPGTFGERDIVRSITLLPGVQSVGEFGTGFNVRGGSADQNLILIENVPLFNSSHLLGLISVINPDLVSNVTLMKAGIPSKYGERASSVMDIRLNNDLTQETTSVMGGIGILNSRALLETPIIRDRATLFLGGRTSYSDFFLRNARNEDLMNSTARFHDLTGTLNIALNPNNRLTLFGYHSFDRFGFGKETTHEYSNMLASMRLNSAIRGNLSSSLILGMSNYRYRIMEEMEVMPQLHYDMNSAIDYQTLKYYFTYNPWPNHTLVAGIQGVRYEIEPGGIAPLGEGSQIVPRTIDTERGVELSAFVSDDISLSDRMSLEVGLRYTQYLQLGPARVYQYTEGLPRSMGSLTDTIYYGSNEVVSRYAGLEPRIGFRYGLDEHSSAKISYNRNNQYINLISNTAIMAPADIWKLSDPHIQPLQSDQYAIGYFRNFLDNTLETSLEMYYKQLHQVIEYRSGAEVVMNEFLETDILNAKGYNYGLELYVRKNTGKLTGWTSYTYSSSQRRTRSIHPDDRINNNTYFPSNYDRPHNLVLNAGYSLSRRVRLAGTFSYSTGRPITLPEYTYWHGSDLLVYFSDRNKYRLPDFHRLDISLTIGENLNVRERGGSSWTFSIMNLYGRKNPYSVFYRREHGSLHPIDSFNLYQLYIIGKPLPTITFNFSF